MTTERLATLRKLDEIGGDVEMGEVIYHCGREAPYELMEAEAEGLVSMKTFFELTDTGKAAIEGAVR